MCIYKYIVNSIWTDINLRTDSDNVMNNAYWLYTKCVRSDRTAHVWSGHSPGEQILLPYLATPPTFKHETISFAFMINSRYVSFDGTLTLKYMQIKKLYLKK